MLLLRTHQISGNARFSVKSWEPQELHILKSQHPLDQNKRATSSDNAHVRFFRHPLSSNENNYIAFSRPYIGMIHGSFIAQND